jgi:hypothetical protein
VSKYIYSPWFPSLRVCSRVLNRLRLAAGTMVPRAEMIDAVFGAHPEGGGLWVEKQIQGAVYSLRRHGFPIRTHYGWGYSYAPSFHEIPVNPSLTTGHSPTAPVMAAVGASYSVEQTPVQPEAHVPSADQPPASRQAEEAPKGPSRGPDPVKLRAQAEKCRRLANARQGRPPGPYLLSLAEHFERVAAEAERGAP